MAAVIFGGLVFVYLTYRGVRLIHDHFQAQAASRADGSLVRYLKGEYLDCSKTKIEWNWTEPQEVGSTVSFIAKFYYCNSEAYSISKEDGIKVEISAGGNHPVAAVEDYCSENDVCYLQVAFNVRISAVYEISIKQNDLHITGSPFKKFFYPGPLSCKHTRLARCGHVGAATSLLVTQGESHAFEIDARDEFNNDCSAHLTKSQLDNNFAFHLFQISQPETPVAYAWEVSTNVANKLMLGIEVFESGCYSASLSYNNQPVSRGTFTLISLTSWERKEVEGNMEKKNVWYECRLMRDEKRNDADDNSTTNTNSSTSSAALAPSARRSSSSSSSSPSAQSSRSKTHRSKTSNSSGGKTGKKVFCYITPRQLIIKEYMMLLIPFRVASFRVNPNTEVTIESGDEMFTINDRAQPRVTLTCPKRNVLVATYHNILYGNIGRSDSFEEKVDFFHQQLLKHHQLTKPNNNTSFRRDSAYLKIDRHNLLNSSMQACKHVDWRRQLLISFRGEEGLDYGGLNREWTHLLCQKLFSSPSRCQDDKDADDDEPKLFRRFNEDPQALTLPAPVWRSGCKLKQFEFAGRLVGKCLLESALGGEHQRHVTAKFARSFLAQLIGMPVTFAHFESDDPDLYTSKIMYILKTEDVDSLELNFTEEVYGADGSVKEVDLVANGSKIKVTKENRTRYLNLVARYRLCDSIKHEIEAFVKGVTHLVPEHLLSVFDENELELVMCGSSEVSVDDMKENCLIEMANSHRFNKIVEWFWAVISSFTKDELARLLQFTTGCSQLPSGGFKSLAPPFKISSRSYNHGMLPTAHTCFNQLCLPNYDSCEQLHRMLKIAISEGMCGFGQA